MPRFEDRFAEAIKAINDAESIVLQAVGLLRQGYLGQSTTGSAIFAPHPLAYEFQRDFLVLRALLDCEADADQKMAAQLAERKQARKKGADE